MFKTMSQEEQTTEIQIRERRLQAECLSYGKAKLSYLQDMAVQRFDEHFRCVVQDTENFIEQQSKQYLKGRADIIEEIRIRGGTNVAQTLSSDRDLLCPSWATRSVSSLAFEMRWLPKYHQLRALHVTEANCDDSLRYHPTEIPSTPEAHLFESGRKDTLAASPVATECHSIETRKTNQTAGIVFASPHQQTSLSPTEEKNGVIHMTTDSPNDQTPQVSRSMSIANRW